MKKEESGNLQKDIENKTKSKKTPDNVIDSLKKTNPRIEKAIAEMDKYLNLNYKNFIQSNDKTEDLESLKKDIKNQNQGIEYKYGPLNKSEETKLFEQIVEDIITDKQNKLKGIFDAKPEVKTRIHEDIMFIIRDGEEFNINELLKKTNLNHVKLTDKALRGYEYIYENDPDLQDYTLSREDFDKRLSRSDIHQQDSLSKLSYAEKISINIYTGDEDFIFMNGMLRGYKAPEIFDDYLMDIAVSSQGLNSLPTIELPTVSRRQNEIGLDNMISLQEVHGVEQVKGFISTAYQTLDEDFGAVQIVYENIRGVNIQALSKHPNEKEYLIPPSTQVRYTGHKIVNGKHIFTAEGANVLLDQNKEASPIKMVEKEVRSLVEQTKKHLAGKDNISTEEAESYIKKIIDINIKYGVINNAEKYLYFKDDEQGKSVFKRDVQSLKKSTKTLKLRDKLLKVASSILENLGFKKLANIFKEKQILHKKLIELNNPVKDMYKSSSIHAPSAKKSSNPTNAKGVKGKNSGGVSI